MELPSPPPRHPTTQKQYSFAPPPPPPPPTPPHIPPVPKSLEPPSIPYIVTGPSLPATPSSPPAPALSISLEPPSPTRFVPDLQLVTPIRDDDVEDEALDMPGSDGLPSNADHRSHDDELLESLADHIVAAVPPASPLPSSSDPPSTLRRRFTNLSLRSVTSTTSTTASAAPSSEEDEMTKALEELEDVEVSAFLARVGSRIQEVQVAVPNEAVEFPSRKAFADANGKVNWLAFGHAYFSTALAVYTPPSLIAPPKRTALSLSLARNQAERLYILAPPSVIENVLDGSIARLWRWESEETWKWCSLYFLLWTFDLIPFFLPCSLLFFLLQAKLYPPSPQEILARSRARTVRSTEAEELSNQIKSTNKLAFAVDGVRGLVGHMWEGRGIGGGAAPGGDGGIGALAKGLHSSMLVGGLAGAVAHASTEKEKEKEMPSPPSALAQAIGGVGVVAGGVGGGRASLDGAPTPRPVFKRSASTMSDAGSVASSSGDKKSKEKEATPKDVSLYRLASDMSRIAGPPAQEALSQVADLSEMVKNLLLHPDHPSFTPVCLRLAATCFFLLVCPTWIQIKSAWAYIGAEFFVLWRLRELYPEYRRALTPWWWVLLGAPTDADYATFILQKRKLQNKPLRGKKTIKRMARSRAGSEATPEMVASAAPAATVSVKTGLAASLSAVGAAIASSSSRPPSFCDPEDLIGSHFALFQAFPGTLLITTNRVRFAPTRGFRTLGMRKFGLKPKEDEGVGPAVARDMIDLLADEIVGVKKGKMLGFEGMVITSKDGQTFSLSNVAQRDDAFNRILSIQSTTWKQL